MSCGATSSILRWLLICRTKIGISAARTTSTRPTIDSTQVMPAAGSIPSAVSSVWNPTRIASITHLMREEDVLKTEDVHGVQPFPWLAGTTKPKRVIW